MQILAPTALLLAAFAPLSVEGHGRLVVPPHRGYIGKLPEYKGLVDPNYSDNGLNAGGIQQTKGGKHGVCGDLHSLTPPRRHENGGVFGRFPQHGKKVVGACYTTGATVDLKVQITANHKGYFEFGLCKLNQPTDVETEECFKSLVQPSGETKWQLPPGNDFFNIRYVLPAGVTCEGDAHCVLRWHYTGWNNPGTNQWAQEHFWNCADVYISKNCSVALQDD